MAQASVKVTGVFTEDGENDRGPWTRYDVKAGSTKYVTFNDELGKKAQGLKGETVTLVYEEVEKNGYTNRTLKGINAHAEETVQSGVGNPVTVQHFTHGGLTTKDEQIARAVAFKGAIDLASGGVLDPDVDTILGVTEAFYTYLTTGALEPETADTRH